MHNVPHNKADSCGPTSTWLSCVAQVRKKLNSGKFETLETRKDGTKFTNRALKAAAEQLQQLSGQYDDMQKQLVEQVGHLEPSLLPLYARSAPACLSLSGRTV